MAFKSGVHPAQAPDWNNLNVLHRNRLPPRSHFHVYSSESDALSYDVAKSNSYSLNGSWQFYLSNSPFEAPEGFEEPSFDTSSWSDIPVPGMWQLNGFGKGPHYTNVQFPIPVDPPNVPFTDNETGSYIRIFHVPSELKGRQIRLRFEGVDSAFHVWVNGREVGYHQGSRNPSEFDISELVNLDQENRLAVRVYQFCDATYIEDQDQWWLSGIFRDVSLIGFPSEGRIEDLQVQTLLDAQYINADLKVDVDVIGSGKVYIKLLDAEKKVVASTSRDYSERTRLNFTLPINDPLKWTAETPNLYHLVVSLDHRQYLVQRIGFRQVEMKDGLIKVNGQRVVFRGVNRHEHHPQFGRAVPFEFLKRDLLIMKKHNINAIRTSHQPSDYRLYDLADEMGFWVMDEADLECHGFESIETAALDSDKRSLPFMERLLLIRKGAAEWTSNNPDWEEAYLDRAKQLVYRDKLHPSVIVWSLGNEAFFGNNHKVMYNWIKSFDPTRPIHYEADLFAETMDMYSRMYPPIEYIIEEFGRDESKQKPLILCEYVHAMGTGPGNIKEYIDAFYKYPRLQGGFVWEWANHGLLTKDKETNEEFYGYGGDFGDIPNDSTFIMDGVLNSQHNPTAGLIEYRKAIEPIQLLEATSTKASFINRYDFISLDHLEVGWSAIDETGLRAEDGTIPVPPKVGPGKSFELDLPTISDMKCESFLNISFRLKRATPYLPAGFKVATAQIPLFSSPISLSKSPSPSSDHVKVSIPSARFLQIATATSTWNFNTTTGALTSWIRSSKELISKPPEIDFWRAPTDNDIRQDGQDWKDRFLHFAKPHTRKVSWAASSEEGFRVAVEQRVAPPILSWSINVVLTYVFRADGSLSIHVKGNPNGTNLPKTLPRIGLIVELSGTWQRVQWFGRGPGESYRDSKFSQQVGLYGVDRVDDLWTDYEVPQETSNRTDTRWLKVSDTASNATLTVQFKDLEKSGESARREFDFQATHYRSKDVEAATHPYKLRKMKREEVILRLDAAHHGLGSGSCGPKTRDEYALKTGPFEFEVVLY